eukprot:m.30783 g.30783  ORF g.30783 m.30783 type:complete len:288 (+) comp6253_c0_seq2:2881-3744(+)
MLFNCMFGNRVDLLRLISFFFHFSFSFLPFPSPPPPPSPRLEDVHSADGRTQSILPHLRDRFRAAELQLKILKSLQDFSPSPEVAGACAELNKCFFSPEELDANYSMVFDLPECSLVACYEFGIQHNTIGLWRNIVSQAWQTRGLVNCDIPDASALKECFGQVATVMEQFKEWDREGISNVVEWFEMFVAQKEYNEKDMVVDALHTFAGHTYGELYGIYESLANKSEDPLHYVRVIGVILSLWKQSLRGSFDKHFQQIIIIKVPGFIATASAEKDEALKAQLASLKN